MHTCNIIHVRIILRINFGNEISIQNRRKLRQNSEFVCILVTQYRYPFNLTKFLTENYKIIIWWIRYFLSIPGLHAGQEAFPGLIIRGFLPTFEIWKSKNMEMHKNIIFPRDLFDTWHKMNWESWPIQPRFPFGWLYILEFDRQLAIPKIVTSFWTLISFCFDQVCQFSLKIRPGSRKFCQNKLRAAANIVFSGISLNLVKHK